MKEDYLWNKTGEDLEIAELEDSLKQFRSINTTPPEIPQKTFAVDKDSLTATKSRFSFKLAFATFACLAIFAFGAFQLFNFENQEFAQNTSAQIKVEKTEEIPKVDRTAIIDNQTRIETPIQPKAKKAKLIPKQQKRIVKAKKSVRHKIKNDQITIKKIKPKSDKIEQNNQITKVTKEEKEAYDKLVEALAITSSQMKIVQEKINGVEKQTDR